MLVERFRLNEGRDRSVRKADAVNLTILICLELDGARVGIKFFDDTLLTLVENGRVVNELAYDLELVDSIVKVRRAIHLEVILLHVVANVMNIDDGTNATGDAKALVVENGIPADGVGHYVFG